MDLLCIGVEPLEIHYSMKTDCRVKVPVEKAVWVNELAMYLVCMYLSAVKCEVLILHIQPCTEIDIKGSTLILGENERSW